MTSRRSHGLAAALGAVAVLVGSVIVNNTGSSVTTVTGTLKVAVAMGDVPLQVTVGSTPVDVTANAQPQVLALAGQEVHASGTKQGGTLTATKVTPATAQSPVARTPKPVNVALVLMEAAGTTFFGSGSQPWTPAYMEQTALDPALAYFTTVSGGQVHATGRMFGTVQSTRPAADCSISDWTNAAAQYVAQTDPGETFTQVAVVANVVNCPFAGIAYVGSSGVLMDVASASVTEHELGHNFGLWHGGLEFNCTACQPPVLNFWDYGDATSVMGSGTSRGYSAFELDKIGWLPPSASASISGPTTVTLTGLENPTDGGTKLVHVGNYVLDFRNGTGVDFTDPASPYPISGVHLYSATYRNTDDEWIPQWAATTPNTTALGVGSTVSDGTWSFKVVAQTLGAGGTATVQITNGTPPSTTTSLVPTSTTIGSSTTTTVKPTTTTTVKPGAQQPPTLTATVEPNGTVLITWTPPQTIARTAIQLSRGKDPTHQNVIATLYTTALAQGYYIDTHAPLGTSWYKARFTTAGNATAYSVPVSVTR